MVYELKIQKKKKIVCFSFLPNNDVINIIIYNESFQRLIYGPTKHLGRE